MCAETYSTPSQRFDQIKQFTALQRDMLDVFFHETQTDLSALMHRNVESLTFLIAEVERLLAENALLNDQLATLKDDMVYCCALVDAARLQRDQYRRQWEAR